MTDSGGEGSPSQTNSSSQQRKPHELPVFAANKEDADNLHDVLILIPF